MESISSISTQLALQNQYPTQCPDYYTQCSNNCYPCYISQPQTVPPEVQPNVPLDITESLTQNLTPSAPPDISESVTQSLTPSAPPDEQESRLQSITQGTLPNVQDNISQSITQLPNV